MTVWDWFILYLSVGGILGFLSILFSLKRVELVTVLIVLPIHALIWPLLYMNAHINKGD